MNKFILEEKDIAKLTDVEGACICSSQIVVDGKKVGCMYREKPNTKYPDSGWRFLSGEETEEYLDDPENFNLLEVNTVCNYDKDIIPFLNSKIGVYFARDEEGNFMEIETEQDDQN